MSTQAAQRLGAGDGAAEYVVADGELAEGSTLGGPKLCLTIKATGAIEKLYAIDAGRTFFGSVVVHHWDEATGVQLAPLPGTFSLYPERQRHDFTLANGVRVCETIFALNVGPDDPATDVAAAYYTIRFRNESDAEAKIGTYAICQLRGHTNHDLDAAYDDARHALVAWNRQQPDGVRAFAISHEPTGYAVTGDHGRTIGTTAPGPLCDTIDAPAGSDPLGIFHSSTTLAPGDALEIAYTFAFSQEGRDGIARTLASVPTAREALDRTSAYYATVLGRSVLATPDPDVNRGVAWAKANMLRTQLHAPTGWSFVNDPTRSNNSVARDTAWFGFGADYITPAFVRDSLLAYVTKQEPSGMIVEYYDIRTGETADYHLNINDNTPLLVLALWHHYNATGDDAFLRQVYPAVRGAMRYALSQRDERGLVWCTSTGTSDWGIVGWRNVIEGYRLSGATTELNSECYAALSTVSHMARTLGEHEDAATYAREAAALRVAIHAHLVNPANGLYYLNIDVDGHARSDITCDLVFPVIFGVADDEMAVRIVRRIGDDDFWTDAGVRTVPRDAPDYGPTHGYGLLGGVWVGVSFWYAFAAARFSPERMADALSSSFRHYSRDPRRNNTVPGQFSEWLHGETLANQGMMLSPWFPPRYLWAAIEGAGGLDLSGGSPSVTPRLAPDWKWLAVRDVPYRDRSLTWFVARTPELRLYSNCAFRQATPYLGYDEDVSSRVRLTGSSTSATALRRGNDFAILVGNPTNRMVTTSLRILGDVRGAYRVRVFDSLRNAWSELGLLAAAEIERGIPVELERKGFWILELEQET